MRGEVIDYGIGVVGSQVDEATFGDEECGKGSINVSGCMRLRI